MQTGGVFVCECGTRVRVVVEGRETSFVRCPNTSCRFRHVVSGRPVDIQIDHDGKWVAYDWKASDSPTISL